MVHHFPSDLTDEEQMLISKYAKLRKKKKQLATFMNPNRGSESDKSGSSIATKRKGEIEAKDSKEVAKKLIKTGAIANIQKTVAERVKGEKSTGFKRSQRLRKSIGVLSDSAKAGYQPFSATHGPGGGFDTGGEDMNPDPPEPPPAKNVKNLYDSFVHARDREERGLPQPGDLPGPSLRTRSDKPRQCNTIYVFGYQITEEMLQTTFAPLGKIVNVSMEVEKNRGFITFDKSESAEKAIAEHNGNIVDGIQLKVELARRQPVIDPINNAASSAIWSMIAASYSQKGGHKDKRQLQAYEENLF